MGVPRNVDGIDPEALLHSGHASSRDAPRGFSASSLEESNSQPKTLLREKESADRHTTPKPRNGPKQQEKHKWYCDDKR